MLKKLTLLLGGIDAQVTRLVVLSLGGVFVITAAILYFSMDADAEMDLYTIQNQEIAVTITETGDIKALKNNEVRLPYSSGRGRGGRGGFFGGGGSASITFLIPEGTRAESGDVLLQLDTSSLITDREGLVDQLINLQQTLEDERLNQETQFRQDARAMQDISFTLSTRRLEVELSQFESANQRKQQKLQLDMSVLDSLKLETRFRSDVVIRKLRLNKAEKRVRDQKQRIDELDARIDSYTMTAEYPALVVYAEDFRTQEKIAIGDTPYPGQSLLLLPDLSTITAVLQVSDLDRGNIWVGQEGKIKLEAYSDIEFHGVVSEFTPISQNSQYDTYSNIKVFEVLIELDGTDEHFKPGLSATVDLVVDKVENVPAVPLSALTEIEGKLFAYVNVDNSLKLREVELGLSNQVMAEVTSGLEEGDEILKKIPLLTGDKVGQLDQWLRDEMAVEMLAEHFEKIEALGLDFDYDRNRGRTEAPRRGGENYQSRSQRVPTYDEIEKYLEAEGLEVTDQSRTQAREFLMRTQNAGRDTVMERLGRDLQQQEREGFRGRGGRRGGGRRGGSGDGGRGRGGPGSEILPATEIIKNR
jgi:HlyD family secretion protein